MADENALEALKEKLKADLSRVITADDLLDALNDSAPHFTEPREAGQVDNVEGA